MVTQGTTPNYFPHAKEDCLQSGMQPQHVYGAEFVWHSHQDVACTDTAIMEAVA